MKNENQFSHSHKNLEEPNGLLKSKTIMLGV